MCCVTLPALLLLLLLLDQVRGRDQDPRADGRCHGCACQPPSKRSLALPCGLLCGWEGARAITRAAGRSCCCCCRFRRGLGRSATFPGLFRAGTGACATSSSSSCCRVEATWLSGVSERNCRLTVDARATAGNYRTCLCAGACIADCSHTVP